MRNVSPPIRAGLAALLIGYLLLAWSYVSSKRPHVLGGPTPDMDMAAGLMMLSFGILGFLLSVLKHRQDARGDLGE